jgi:large subunit ribosomal protein L15
LIDKVGITEINPKIMNEHGLTSKRDMIKILGRGELSAAVNISAHGFSSSAKKAIEDKGGSATVIQKHKLS